MKNIAISLAAAWGASIRSFIDGDLFRESNLDLLWGDMADRLGYLKNTVDGAVLTTGAQTIDGDKTFSGSTIFEASGSFNVDGVALFSDDVGVNGELSTFGAFSAAGALSALAEIAMSTDDLTDTDQTVSSKTVHRCPVVSANRTYTLPVGINGQLALVTRVGTEAFTVTVKRAGAVTLGVISAGSPGWLLLQNKAVGWRVVAWGGTVTGIDPTI